MHLGWDTAKLNCLCNELTTVNLVFLVPIEFFFSNDDKLNMVDDAPDNLSMVDDAPCVCEFVGTMTWKA